MTKPAKKCKACGKRHTTKNQYCNNCNPDNIHLNDKWELLLSLKQRIQELEQKQSEYRKKWMEAAENVKSLGQQIGDKKKELFEMIQ